MSAKKNNATILRVSVAACAACCAGPILGVLAAIGVGTAAGFLLIGTLALVIGPAAVAVVVVRRRQRSTGCLPEELEVVLVKVAGRDDALAARPDSAVG